MIGITFYRWTNGNLTLNKFATGNRRKAGWRPFGFLKEICRPGSCSSSWLESRIERSERRASWLVMARRYTTQLYYWKSGTEPWVNIVPRGTVQHFYSLSYCWWSWRTVPQHYWRLASPFDSISCTSNTR